MKRLWKLCRAIVILAAAVIVLLSRPFAVYCVLFWETGLDSGFKRYEWEYAKVLERDGDPLWPEAERMLQDYMLEDQTVRVEEHSWHPYEPNARYVCFLQEDGKDLFPFWVRAVNDEEETVIPEGTSLWERIRQEKDFMAHVAFYTDFKEQLFRYCLLKSNQEYYERCGGYHVLRLEYPFYQESWRFAVWNFEEGLVLSSFYDMDGMETVFRESYEKMREWQRQIPADLSQTIRISKNAPEYFLSFTEEYGAQQQEVLDALCEERYAYNLTLSGEEMGWYAEVMEEQERKERASEAEMTEEAGNTEGFYTVRAGDCLWHIAEEALGDSMNWKELYDQNKALIGGDPNLLLPGTVLHLPENDCAADKEVADE